MNAIAVTNQTFTIAETAINMVDGLYSLNDLHKASGNAEKHRPAFFIRNQEVTDLANEIMQCANLHSEQVIRKINGGHNRGTYACKEIVYRYAMWISPKFALLVIRAFDALVSRTDSKQREALITACDKLAIRHALRSDVYTMVANEFGYEKVTQIPTPLLPEAIAFVYEMLLRTKPTTNPTMDESLKQDVRLLITNACLFRSWFNSVKAPIGMLNPKIITEISTILAWGIPSAEGVNKKYALGVDTQFLLERNWLASRIEN